MKRPVHVAEKNAYRQTNGSKSYAIAIRPAEKRDLAFIRALSGEVFDQYGPYEEMLSQWFLSGVARTLVAVVNEKPVGYVMLSVERGRHALLRVAELLAIAVEPHHCHCGVGNCLMRALVGMAEESGVDIIILHTDIHNLAAQALFENNGFSPVGVKKKFYEEGQSALMMRKEIFHSR